MSQKLHNDPIVYRAYGTVRGTYKPSKADPRSGTLTTDDGVKFPVIVSHEVAALLEHEPKSLAQQVLWKCYFKTRPASLELRKVETDNVDKKRSHSFRVDRFQVDGKVLKINKESVTVQIKSNTSAEDEPFTLTLKGSFEYDKSCPFWRFKLKREGKTYVIETATKLPLPRVEKVKTPPPPPKKEKKVAPPPPPKQQKKKKELSPTPTYPPSLFKKRPPKPTPAPTEPTPTPTPTDPAPKKRVFNLVDKSKK